MSVWESLGEILNKPTDLNFHRAGYQEREDKLFLRSLPGFAVKIE